MVEPLKVAVDRTDIAPPVSGTWSLEILGPSPQDCLGFVLMLWVFFQKKFGQTSLRIQQEVFVSPDPVT